MEAVSPDRRENKLAGLFITGPAPQLTQQSLQLPRFAHFFSFFFFFPFHFLGADLIAQLSGFTSQRRRTTYRRTNFERIATREPEVVFAIMQGRSIMRGFIRCDLPRLIPVPYVRLKLFL